MADVGVFGRYKGFGDFQEDAKKNSLSEALMVAKLQSAAKGDNLPAALQLANEYQKRLADGDLEGANTIAAFAKTTDKGLVRGEDGNYYVAGGYAPSLGEISAVKAGMAQQAKKDVDAVMNPIIAGGEAGAKLGQQLRYEPNITMANKRATNAAEIEMQQNKKSVQANSMMGLLDEAEALLPKASSGRIGRIGAYVKGEADISDEATQADKALGVISAGLVSNVPRMEGPQSDRDVIMYREAAGDIANISKPIGDRLSAVKTIRRIQQKYATPQATDIFGTEAPSTNFMNTMRKPYSPRDAKQQFNERKAAKQPKPRLKYNPATGDFE